MNPFKRLFYCTRGSHEVAHQHMHELSKESGWMRLDTEREVSDQPKSSGARRQGLTFFRCQHCPGRFVTIHTSDPLNDKAMAVTPEFLHQLPENIPLALAKTWWWPNKPTKGGVGPDGCYHGPETDPLMPGHKPPRTRGTCGGSYGTAMHGGELPGNPDLSTPEGLAALQAMLPHGPGPDLAGIEKTNALLTDLKLAAENWHPEPEAPGPSLGRLALDIIEASKVKHEAHMERRAVKDQVFLAIAKTIALLGTCCRLKVGCVLLDITGKVVGMGYNGAGPGMDHCDPTTCNEHCRCRRTRHAEKNALSNCSGAPWTAYLTHEPCEACAKDLIAEGVRRVVYISPYTSIAAEERAARQEWIDHYRVSWEQGSTPEQA